MRVVYDFHSNGMSNIDVAVELFKCVIDTMSDVMDDGDLAELHEELRPYFEAIPDWNYIEWDEFESALEGE